MMGIVNCNLCRVVMVYYLVLIMTGGIIGIYVHSTQFLREKIYSTNNIYVNHNWETFLNIDAGFHSEVRR